MGIAIIGAGNVGMALGKAFVARGESVVFGVPDPAKYRDAVAKLGAAASIGATTAASAASETVILAVPYAAAAAVAGSILDWHNKILVDATNPLAPGLAGLSLGTTTSGAEQIAAAARGARVIALATLIGFDAVDCGGLQSARYLEPLAMTWIHLAFKMGLGRRFAFARVTR